jgi:putative ABC transport system permease protein
MTFGRGLGQDFKYAARSLRSRPLLVVVAVAVLAVGIGASTAVFSVVDAVLLRPLPFADAGRLVVAWQRSPDNSVPFIEVSYPDYLDWRQQARTFESMAIIPTINQGFVLAGDEPLRVQGRLVSGNFFEVLGGRALVGRTLRPDDDRAGASRVVTLGHGLWLRRFGGDPAIVGRRIVVDGTPMEVVGVMPRSFRYPPKAEMWTPVVPAIPEAVANRGVCWAIVVGRLASGARVAQAQAELDGIVARLAKANPYAPADAAVVTPLTDEFFGPARPALLVLLAAVLLVLLVACANVSALLLARAADRQREIAVRLALGASRGRLVRQLLCESALITLASVTGGILLAQWSLDALVALVPADVPRLQDAAIDARVLAFTVALAAGAALVAGLAPALLASRPSLTNALEGGARTAGPGSAQRRLQGLLVGAEAAVALVLLAGAGLMAQTFQNLRRVDLGYDPRHVRALEVAAPRGKYEKPAEWRSLYQRLVERIDHLPGVEASAGVFLRPLWGQMGNDWFFTVEGQSDADRRRNPHANLESVTPGYFGAMRTPLLRGRDFTDRDAEGMRGVAIVSKEFSRRYWPGQDPIGKRLKIPLPESPYHLTWLTVVGVVGDARYRELQASRLDLYLSYLQSPYGPRHLVVRTTGDPLAAASSVSAIVRGMDRDLLPEDITSMDSVVQAALGGPRFGMQLLSAFALAALALAALGTYGVMAFLVSRRTREIGVRMALGARGTDVLGLVVGQGMRPVLAGLAVGVAGSFAAGRAISTLLFGVAPHDALTTAGAATLLAAVGALACYFPARRAARLDPAVALRRE